MSFSLSTFNNVLHPRVNFSRKCLDNVDQFTLRQEFDKDKVVFVLGATGTGKTRLSIDLATRFDGEVINSDCMQIYKGLDIITNKVTDEERCNVPHHLLGFLDPLEKFTAVDFLHHASLAIKDIRKKGKLPIIAGGSNSYVNALAAQNFEFRLMNECCFLWVDVRMPILSSVVSKRVDSMAEAGLVKEGRSYFDPNKDYTPGIRRSIGVHEMHDYYENETSVDEFTRNKLLETAINDMKVNTRDLTVRQVQNILKLEKLLIWKVHRLDATNVKVKCGKEADEAYDGLVFGPSTKIVARFLHEEC